MRLIFKKITVQNFQSFGNTPTTVDLNTHQTTLLIAKNGVGKTALIFDSIYYALYGVTMRKTKLAEITNWINRKDCKVILDLELDGQEIVIERGMKPDVFTVTIDGNDMWSGVNPSTRQKNLQTKLQLSNDIVSQFMFIGRKNIPFLERTPAARREFVEFILNLEIYSKANEIAKQRKKVLVKKLDDLNSACAVENARKEELVYTKENSRTPNVELIKKCQDFLDSTSDKEEKGEAVIKSAREKLNKVSDQLNTLSMTKYDLENKIRDAKEYNDNIQHNSVCPTCGQPTSDLEPKDTATFENQLEEYQTEINKFIDKRTELNDKITTNVDKLNDLRTKRSNYQTAIETENSFSVAASDIDDRISEIEDRLIDLNLEIVEFESDIANISVILDTLKKGVAKDKIISEYIPFFNDRINYYLDKMNFQILFEFNESFDVTFKARYKDTATYSALSTGQQMRIDFAVLLAWRDVAAEISSVETNLLVIDEFGNNLDEEGFNDFVELINDIDDLNFIGMVPKQTNDVQMDRILNLEIEQNFSVLR